MGLRQAYANVYWDTMLAAVQGAELCQIPQNKFFVATGGEPLRATNIAQHHCDLRDFTEQVVAADYSVHEQDSAVYEDAEVVLLGKRAASLQLQDRDSAAIGTSILVAHMPAAPFSPAPSADNTSSFAHRL